ncbi:flagellar hook-length control protein FliK [Pseudooceanicola sp.]|uniref:flagellar hook-length control protein FliK n=1 Tax=Pseudooceanicola sp. TaxID=1914328 RepID=UPI004058EFC7
MLPLIRRQPTVPAPAASPPTSASHPALDDPAPARMIETSAKSPGAASGAPPESDPRTTRHPAAATATQTAAADPAKSALASRQFAALMEDGKRPSVLPADPVGSVPDRTPPDPLQTASAQKPTTPAARTVPEQIVHVVRQAAEGSVEVRLSPEELGRVRMTLVPREDGLAITLSADRPETLDLMRRHGGDLNRVLMAAGYDNVDLTFSGGRTGQKAAESRPAATDDAPATPVPEESIAGAASGLAASAGLDLRL